VPQYKAVLSPIAAAAAAHQRLIPDNSTSSNSRSAGGDASQNAVLVSVVSVATPSPLPPVSLPQSPSLRGERGAEATKKREGMRKDTEVCTVYTTKLHIIT
jgi:hypothetical protein